MKKPQPPQEQKPRRRGLSDEDEALWAYTAKSLKPLKRKSSRVHPAMPAEPGREAPPRPPAHQSSHHALSASQARREDEPRIEIPYVPEAKVPALNVFDRRAAKKLRQGRFDIEARIDLHGMRQVEAHGALKRFLFSCHARGLRWVLVITGKGKSQRQSDDEVGGFGWGDERGVLRRNVPMWLAEPELRAIVVSFTAAALQHGGEGALYIQLRNPERVGR